MYSSSSQMKSYSILFSRIIYYFFTRPFFFFFFFILPDIFSIFKFFFFLCSPSLLRSLPLFSVLSLFSIARKKEIAWVEHGVVVSFARRGFARVIFFFIGCFGFSGCGFARRGLGFACRSRPECGGLHRS